MFDSTRKGFIMFKKKTGSLFLALTTIILAVICCAFLASCGSSGSKGLAYSPGNNDTYMVSLGECKDENIVSPEEYKGKPVTIIDFSNDSLGTVINSLAIPASVTSIKGLTQITVKSIAVDENNSTYQCSGNCLIIKNDKNLIWAGENFTIPDNGSIYRIDQSVFAGRSNLTEITIPEGVKTIDRKAFANCENLSKVKIPASVTWIGEGAFANCSNLKSFEIAGSNDSIKRTIADGAFLDCVQLESFTIPKSITSVCSNAFSGCEKLTSVVFENPQGWSWKEDIFTWFLYLEKYSPEEMAEMLRNKTESDNIYWRIYVDPFAN